MRRSLRCSLVALTLLAGCGGDGAPPEAPRPTIPPPAVPAPLPTTAAAPRYAGPSSPITAPIDLAYGDADFRTTVTVTVKRGSSGAGTIATESSGQLLGEGAFIRAQLVTERLSVDGKPSDNAYALLVQELSMTRKGQDAHVASRSPSAGGEGVALPPRFRVLEQGWRDRLPAYTATPVTTGDAVYTSGPSLGPLRQLLGDRPYRIEGQSSLRATAVALAPCPAGQCLLVSNEGQARLVAGTGTLDLTLAGYALIDPTTGLTLRARDELLLRNPTQAGDAGTLTMTVDTVTSLLRIR